MKTIIEILILVKERYKKLILYRLVPPGLCHVSELLVKEQAITSKEKEIFLECLYNQRNHCKKLKPRNVLIWFTESKSARTRWLTKQIKKEKEKR